MKAKPMTPQLRVPQADCFRKCSCLVSSMSYCFRGFNLGPLDDYNVQLLVPTVGSVLHTHPTGAWLPHVATDSNRVRSGPRLVTSVNRNQIDTGAQFSVILGTGANLHNYILIEILLKKCDIESVNLWVQLTVQTFTTMY